MSLTHEGAVRTSVSLPGGGSPSLPYFPGLCYPELSTVTEVLSALSNTVATELLKHSYCD